MVSEGWTLSQRRGGEGLRAGCSEPGSSLSALGQGSPLSTASSPRPTPRPIRRRGAGWKGHGSKGCRQNWAWTTCSLSHKAWLPLRELGTQSGRGDGGPALVLVTPILSPHRHPFLDLLPEGDTGEGAPPLLGGSAGPTFLLSLHSVPLSVRPPPHRADFCSVPAGVAEMKSSCPQGPMPGGLVKGCEGAQPLPAKAKTLPPPRTPPPGGAPGSGPGLPGAGDQSPPDGSSLGRESLRCSFSEQRVSLNCL